MCLDNLIIFISQKYRTLIIVFNVFICFLIESVVVEACSSVLKIQFVIFTLFTMSSRYNVMRGGMLIFLTEASSEMFT